MSTQREVAPRGLRIQTPLIAFETVYRRTGTLRRTCVFENDTARPIQLRVRYGFREHSWIQLVSEGQDSVEDQLVIEPGATRVHVLMDADSSNFPYDRFRGRVFFDLLDAGEEATATAPWIEISFEEIEELSDFDGYAAIDLGTSNSMIALYHLRQDVIDGAPWNPELEAAQEPMPSAIFIRDLAGFRRLQDRSCTVGREALEAYGRDPNHDPRSLQLGVKSLIGGDRMLAADAEGAGGYVQPRDVLYMLSRAIRERAQSHQDVRARLPKLIVTFPPTWDHLQIGQWKDIFRQLGYGEEDLDLSLDEASAAALFSIHQWTREPDTRNRLLQDLLPSREEVHEKGRKGERYTLNMLSFDFGGGTIDLAFVRVKLTMLDDVIRMGVSLQGSDSLDYGGDQVTLAVFKLLKRRLAMAISDPRRSAGTEREEDLGESAQRASVESGLFLLPGKGGRRRSPPRHESAASAAAHHVGQSAGRDTIRARWDELEGDISAEMLPDELERAIDSVFPTRFWQSAEEPISPPAKRNFSWLWEQAERLKREIFEAANRETRGAALSRDAGAGIERSIYLRDVPSEILGAMPPESEAVAARATVRIGEIYESISAPLMSAVDRARRLVGDQRVDRVVLTGQSSWIPLVRRLFMLPGGEGGFGLAPSKIEFDERNAKAAVSKGACLLHVMRDTLVGFSVDLSEFKANLLSDIFYVSPIAGERTLFSAGPIDDLTYVEESPDPESFARHLAVFSGTRDRALGHFDFRSEGESPPEFEALAQDAAKQLGLDSGFCEHEELMRMQSQEPDTFAAIAAALRDWPERALIGWMESTANEGSAERPVYRYYLTRNRNVIVVRDQGSGDKRLFPLLVERSKRSPGVRRSRSHPFSGVH